MKWAVLVLFYALVASCVMRPSDSFVTAGGLQDIRSREDLFARDVQLAIALTGAPYDRLPAGIRTCLVDYTRDHASAELLNRADGFVVQKTEASWQEYRRAAGDGLDADEINAMMQACESSAYQTASR